MLFSVFLSCAKQGHLTAYRQPLPILSTHKSTFRGRSVQKGGTGSPCHQNPLVAPHLNRCPITTLALRGLPTHASVLRSPTHSDDCHLHFSSKQFMVRHPFNRRYSSGSSGATEETEPTQSRSQRSPRSGRKYNLWKTVATLGVVGLIAGITYESNDNKLTLKTRFKDIKILSIYKNKIKILVFKNKQVQTPPSNEPQKKNG